ncbi:MAG: hypothetical protein IKV23_03920, partial [Bacteroidaceae bacterium]|nr:hypothetical protein [Bacteroidaceae bacterium]
GLRRASIVNALRLDVHFVQAWLRSLRVNASIHPFACTSFLSHYFLKTAYPQPKFLFGVQLV